MAAVLVAGMLVAPASAKDNQTADTWLDFARSNDETVTYQEVEWEKPVPIAFYLDYTLVSDYVWRGINLSEYSGEGREGLNHQFTAGVAVDLEGLTGVQLGTLAFTTWFEWYADQQVLTPDHGGHNQEIDFVLSWSYDVPQIYSQVELGWIVYTFPPLSGDAHRTQELYVKVGMDDSAIWRLMGFDCPMPIINPYIYWGIDIDDGASGQWIELGISHDIAMAQYGMENVPVLKDITVTPSLVLGIDHRYLHIFSVDRTNSGDPDTKLANLNYGVSIDYDLSSALGIPPQYGALSVGTFINYSQALSDKKLSDELYGGMSVSWEW